jgi:hypothetical protein
MGEAAGYLQQLDDAWAHRWESLREVLKDLGEDEAAWQPAAWRGEPVEDGWPLPGSVLWQIAHIAHCKRHYADIVRGREKPAAPVAPRIPADDLAGELAALAAAHAAERAAFASVRDDELGVLAGGQLVLREFLAMAVRHDSWHAAQIAVARRLWRHRGPPDLAP